jgi:tellurite resistance protein TerB
MPVSARPSVASNEARLIEDRVNSIYDAWLRADTPINRAAARNTGLVVVKEFQPILSRRRMLRSRYSFIPHLSYRTAEGLATLAITSQGLGIRKYRGHISKAYQWGNKPGMIKVFKTNNAITKTEIRDAFPPFFCQTLLRISRNLFERRIKHLIRKGIYSEIEEEREEAKRTVSRKFMEACIAGCAVIANADGVVTGDEKLSILKYITTSDLLSLYDTEEVILRFEEHCRKYEFDHQNGEAEALKVIAPLRVSAEDAHALVRACSKIAAADGTFDHSERSALERVCAELGLDSSKFVPHS